MFICVIIAICAVVGLYAIFVEPNLLITTEVIKNDITTLTKDKIKLVFFSDTHFGRTYSYKNITKIVKEINKQTPDIVVFAGDFIDNYYRDKNILDIDYLTKELSNIEAKYGKFAVYGNHDYGGGGVRIYEDLMNSSGFTILKNNSNFIDELNINIIGYDDILIGYTEPDLYNIASEDYNIIISHEPDVADEIDSKGDSLMVSGHSHGGQIFLPFVSDMILPRGGRIYTKGNYDNKGISENIDLFVSCGVGTTIIPVRFLNVPEIVSITLNK